MPINDCSDSASINPTDASFAEGLDKVRTRLLDLTLANRLIHFRHTKRSSLRVVDELPDILWSRLREGSELLFIPVPEPVPESNQASTKLPLVHEHAKSIGLATDFDLPAPPTEHEKPKTAHRDNKVQCLLYPSDLEACLRTLASAARSALDETGTNMLHLVFGFLEWSEGEHPDKKILSPLLNLPVTLRRGDVDPRSRTFKFHITHSGEDIASNISLQEKMRRDFGIHLPSLEDEQGPEEYFARVREVLEPTGWRVRRQITLALLSFGRLLMYRDLDPDRWPSGSDPLHHPRVRELFEGTERPPCDVGREYPLDDETEVPDLPPIVLDADSSQHSALVDVLRGRNLVIQGPPGTGKSQTIANLIAAAMVRGKSVLFIAEKLAALEVVRRRLDDVGLGLFCLELHSHKTQKNRILKDIAARLEARGSFEDASGLDDKLQLVVETRRELTAHAEQMHATIGAIGWSVFDVIWGRAIRGAELGNLTTSLREVSFPDPSLWSLATLESIKTSIESFAGHLMAIRSHHRRWIEHPFAGIERPPEVAEEARLFQMLAQTRECAWALHAELTELMKEAAVMVDASHSALDPWLHEVAYLSSLRGVQSTDLLVQLAKEPSITAVASFCDEVDACTRLADSLRESIPQPVNVSEPTLDKARVAAASLKGMGIRTPTLGAMDEAFRSLGDIRRRVIEGDSLRGRVSQLLGVEIPSTLGGLLATAEVLTLAQSAPYAQLQLRSPGLDVESTEHVFRSVLHEAQAIWGLRTSLDQRFELSLIPGLEALKKHGGACATAGTFRFLSSEYQAARQCHGSFSRGGSPDDPKVLAGDFQQLAAYRARVDSFAANPEYQQVLGPAFRAMDTPFQDVATLRAWQLCAAQTLGWALPSVRQVAERMTSATVETLRAIAALVPDAAAERNAMQSALGTLQNTLAARGGTPPSPEVPISQALQTLEVFLGEAHTAVQTLQEVGVAPSCSVDHLTSALDGLSSWMRQGASLEDRLEVRGILGPAYQGASTVVGPLRQLLQLARSLDQSHLPQVLCEWLRHAEFPARVEVLLNRTQHILAALHQLDAVHAQLDTQVGLHRKDWYRGGPIWGEQATAQVVAKRAQEALEQTDQLPSWRGLLRARGQLVDQGFSGLLSLVDAETIEPAILWQVAEYLVFDRLATKALEEQPTLAAFDGIAHERILERFRRYDLDTIHAFRKRAAHLVDQRPVPEGIRTGPVATHSDLALLEHECRKQRRHIPIRRLVRRGGAALQALAPCFMMGPRAVAQYLEPGALTFDIVVMDEASQLRPEDAIGAICRARQVAIIGDPLQLPPTSFFDRMSDPDEIDEEQATTFDDAESILDVAGSVYSPIRRLRWHYRSLHENLISFSNNTFYEGSLVVFPSPIAAAKDLGLRFERVEGAVYQSGLNEIEARSVVDAVIDHLKNASHRSLGVVAMNFKQRDRIEELLHGRLKDDDSTRAILDEVNGGVEPLFVKNLENVQGDERDVVFVSVTYGKGPDGRLLRRFGPLNGSAGPRRLNVLFTRAKRQVRVFCSFDPEELNPGASGSEGARVLGAYLAFAKSRTRSTRDWDRQVPSRDCERALARALEEHGYSTVPRVGVAGAYLDLAVRQKERDGEFVLGIQIDGLDYRRSYSARDRDRLRPAALTSLGWPLIHVWSLDWHRDPSGTLRRILDALGSGTREGVR